MGPGDITDIYQLQRASICRCAARLSRTPERHILLSTFASSHRLSDSQRLQIDSVINTAIPGIGAFLSAMFERVPVFCTDSFCYLDSRISCCAQHHPKIATCQVHCSELSAFGALGVKAVSCSTSCSDIKHYRRQFAVARCVSFVGQEAQMMLLERSIEYRVSWRLENSENLLFLGRNNLAQR